MCLHYRGKFVGIYQIPVVLHRVVHWSNLRPMLAIYPAYDDAGHVRPHHRSASGKWLIIKQSFRIIERRANRRHLAAFCLCIFYEYR